MSKYTRNPFVVSFLFLIFSIIFLIVFYNKISKDSLGEQIQHRQQLAVRSVASSIEIFLNSVGRASIILANNTSQENLDQFTSIWEDSKISELVVTDKKGIVIRNSNPQKVRDFGVDTSKRDYYQWSKTAKVGEYKVFTPILSKVGASKGKYVVIVATPLVTNGEYKGVVAIAVLLSDINGDYLDNLKVLESNKTYLVTSTGEIIYSDSLGLTGSNIKEAFKNNFIGKTKILEILSNDLESDSETKLKLALPNMNNNSKLEPYLISTAPIKISDNLWKVVVSVPEKDLFVFRYSFFNKQVVAIFIVVTIFILLTLRASRNSGYSEAVVDEHKRHGIVSRT